MATLKHQQEEITQTIIASQRLFLDELAKAEFYVAQNELDAALQIAVQLSTYAYLNFTSFFTSYRLEKLIAQIGQRVIQPTTNKPHRHTEKRKILHVASELYELGGHTPLMLKWIQRDSESDHQLLLTRQSKTNIPTTIFNNHGISPEIVCWGNSGESLVETAQQLLQYSTQFDFLVFHIHPNDVVPLLAFANQKPVPIYFLNHADHCFWLGASIIDGLIQLRETCIITDKETRLITTQPQFLLPIPVEPVSASTNSESDIRNKYHIPQDVQKILLTTSTESKFNPILDYNYFESVIPVLNQNPDTLLLIVGIGKDKPLAVKYKHPQIMFMGYLQPKELADIEQLCTLYLETIPYSSFTAMLQVLMKQKPVQFMYAPPALSKLFSDETLYAKNQQEWQQTLQEKLQHPKKLADYSQSLYNNVSQFYTENVWRKGLEKLYAIADSTKQPSKPTYHTDKVEDIGINEWLSYGISLKEPYRYPLFSEKSKRIQLNRIVSFLSIYSKTYPFRKKMFPFGLKEITSRLRAILFH